MLTPITTKSYDKSGIYTGRKPLFVRPKNKFRFIPSTRLIAEPSQSPVITSRPRLIRVEKCHVCPINTVKRNLV